MELNIFKNRDKLWRRIPCASILAFVSVLIIYFIPSLESALELKREAVLKGEFWRLLSGHLTHCSGEHLLWDVLVFAGLGSVCELYNRKRFLACMFFSAISISLAICIFHPELSFYRGLSGIDSALFGLLAISLLKESIRDQNKKGIILISLFLVLFFGKTALEIVSGSTIFVSEYGSNVIPIPLSHIAGFISGTITGLFPASTHYLRSMIAREAG